MKYHVHAQKIQLSFAPNESLCSETRETNEFAKEKVKFQPCGNTAAAEISKFIMYPITSRPNEIRKKKIRI